MPTRDLDLQMGDLVDGFRGLSKGRCLRAAEAASICLARQHEGARAVPFDSNRPDDFLCSVTRLDVSEEMENSYDPFELAEDGAEAVSVLLLAAMDEGARFRRSMRKTGIDFWVSSTGDMFQDGRRLEVSGLYSACLREVRSRVREKRKQTDQSAGSGPAVVVVVEFGAPLVWMEDV